jgi:hypothetical protein
VNVQEKSSLGVFLGVLSKYGKIKLSYINQLAIIFKFSPGTILKNRLMPVFLCLRFGLPACCAQATGVHR